MIGDQSATATATRAVPHPWPIWGHDEAVESLRRSMQADRVRHAYLLAGPAGVGKTALALEFTKALLCTGAPVVGASCGVCLSCRKISREVHPDVQRFDVASQTAAAAKPGGKNTTLTIDTVRLLVSTASLRPMEGRWRVMMLDDAELMQETAQEALLKTLEEPPSFTVMLVLTDDIQTLLPTIQSRCEVLELRPVALNAIRDGLARDGVEIGEAADLAALAGGSPGWAIRASRQPELRRARESAVERALAWIGATPYQRIVTAFKLGDGFSKRREVVFADLDALTGVWRDVMLASTGQSDYLHYRFSSGQIVALAESWTLESVFGAVRSVRACVADLEANVRPRLAIESMVLQWPTS